jgi:hypothetical protein
MHRRREPRIRAVIAVALLALLAAGDAGGQLVPPHAENAAAMPAGMIRLTASPSWARSNAWLTGQGSETMPLGAAFASDSLGSARFPALGPAELAVRALSGDPGFRLSLGRLASELDTRVVRTSFALEYGLSSRFSAGVMMPVVQARTSYHLVLDAEGLANVGPNPARLNAARFAEVSAVRQQIAQAAANLDQRLTSCRANPAQTGCGALVEQEAAALALMARSGAVIQGLNALYGVEQAGGSPFVPVTGSAAQGAIVDRLAEMSAAYAAFLGTGGNPISARPPFATAGAGIADLRTLFLAGAFGLPRDSLVTADRIGIGDIELGARYLVLDSRTADLDTATFPRRMRLALTGLVRLGTGSPARPDFYLDQPLGDGQTDVEGGAVLDILAGRFGATIGARYTAQLGEVEVWRVPDESGWVNPFDPVVRGTRTLGNLLSVHVAPRARLGPALSVDGHWSILHRGDDDYRFDLSSVNPEGLVLRPSLDGPRGGYTVQQLGFGLTFSTLAQWEQRRVRVPIDVSFAHIRMATASGSAVPRQSVDRIQLRLYYPLRRR